MASNRKWLLLSIAVLAALLIVTLRLAHRHPLLPNAVLVSFLGYTNGGSLRFALFSVSNQAPYSVGWREMWSEVEGSPEHKARIVNRSLPGFSIEPVLNGERAFLIAIGEPRDTDQPQRWRFNMTYSPYTLRDRWWHFSFRHPNARKMERILHLANHSPLGASNQVTVSTAWLTNADNEAP